MRARLELWGFNSFIEYLYTICELVFLEGFFPSLDVGLLTKDEMKIIRRVVSSIKANIGFADERIIKKHAPKRTLKSRLELIKLAGMGKVPVTTGLLLGMGESLKSRKLALQAIKDIHLEYGNIQNFEFNKYYKVRSDMPATLNKSNYLKLLTETVELARKILPPDIQLSVPAADIGNNVKRFINMGVRDIGRLDAATDSAEFNHKKFLKGLEIDLKKKGLGLQHRLPIFSKYIVDNWYSNKLAQNLDRYRLLLLAAQGDPVATKELQSKGRKRDF